MKIESSPPRISTLYRLLAWIILICAAVAGIAAVSGILAGRESTQTWPEIVIGLLGLVFLLPLCYSVAVRGRPPRWWATYEGAISFKKALRRYEEKRGRKTEIE
jgi:hypothetical protein